MLFGRAIVPCSAINAFVRRFREQLQKLLSCKVDVTGAQVDAFASPVACFSDAAIWLIESYAAVALAVHNVAA